MADRSDAQATRPLPLIYDEERPFWEGTRAHEIRLQRCDRCGCFRFPIGPACPFCLSFDYTWTGVSQGGVVSDFVVFHRPWKAWLRDRVPYAVVQVELPEGPRLTTNILGVEPSKVRIGMPVEAVFETLSDEITLLQFRATDVEPAGGEHGDEPPWR